MLFSQELSMLITSVCEECGRGTEDLVRFVKKHDKEQIFFDTVSKLNTRLKWRLLDELWISEYNIFKPWFYKELMEVINVTSTEGCAVDIQIHSTATGLYEFYKKAFEAGKEVELQLSQKELERQHRYAIDEAANTIIDLIDDGAVDPTTLEILPEYKEQVLNRLSKRSD